MRSEVFTNLTKMVKGLFDRKGNTAPHQAAGKFRDKYATFQDLLEANSELLKIISEIEEKQTGRTIFGMTAIRSISSRAVFYALRMLTAFERLSGRPVPQLSALIEGISGEIKAICEPPGGAAPAELVLPYARLDKSMVDAVGGKSANLGEMASRAGLPTPRGFAITTAAFELFLRSGGLADDIRMRKMEIRPDDLKSIQEASEDIQRLIISAPLPEAAEAAITGAFADLARECGLAQEELKVAVRSSAVGEDSELTHAGQYLSMLNVRFDKLVMSYKYVVASLYTPRAMAYRLLKGVPDDLTAMGAACLEMVDSKAAGVMYTRHPFDVLCRDVVINAVYGLGPFAVDGVVTPDSYRVEREGLAVKSLCIPVKPVKLVMNDSGGLEEQNVATDLAKAPCLSEEQIKTLAGYGLTLEAHYGCALDIEWALDQGDRLFLLQARPLGVVARGAADASAPPVPGHEVLFQGGEIAEPGAGAGIAVFVKNDEDLENFPDGGVLVAEHSSPKFMLAMNKAAAILTAHGSVTGHMASLSREFGVPSLLSVGEALAAVKPGMEITVDAITGRIYAGRVTSLLKSQAKKPTLMQGTPVFEVLTKVAGRITPLNLIDPKSPDFSPAKCRTLHDLMRYLHEMCYSEMFTLSDMASSEEGGAVRLKAVTGLDLYIIDLGGGLIGEHLGGGQVGPEDIASAPMRSLLEGLVLNETQLTTARPVHLSGFFSVMGEQLLGNSQSGGQRFGDKSYAVISDKYVNFSSRVGYHYGVLDAYCGQTVSKNYITFSFKGGAADDVRRARRATAIGRILEALGFTVEASGDRVSGRFLKYPDTAIAAHLRDLGRLLQFTRQTDMLMTSEESITAMVDSFMSGEWIFHGVAPAEDTSA